MNPTTDEVKLTDEFADWYYGRGYFLSAAGQYSRSAASFPSNDAWQLRVKAIMSHIRRKNRTNGIRDARKIFNYFLAHTPEYDSHDDVKLAEVWLLVAEGRLGDARMTLATVASATDPANVVRRVATVSSHIEWRCGNSDVAHMMFDEAARLLRSSGDRNAQLDNLVWNLPYLNWPNRFVMGWSGLWLAQRTGRQYDGRVMLRSMIPFCHFK